jgi:predicted ATPase
MLTRLQVSGFKNLVDVDVRFGPFTCVVGPNGAGKSNLFDAIRFLHALAGHTLMEAASSVRDQDSRTADVRNLFHHAGDRYAERMSLAAEMIVPAKAVDDLGQDAKASITFLRYSLELAYRDPGDSRTPGSLEITREELVHIPQGAAGKHLLFPHRAKDWRRSVVHGQRRVPFFISTEEDGGQRVIKLHQDGGSSGRPLRRSAANLPRTVLSVANAAESPTVVVARREMEAWRMLQLEPSALRRPDEFSSPTRLETDGSHLAATLYRLARNAGPEGDDASTEANMTRTCSRIAIRLSELIDDVRNINIDRDEKRELLTLYAQDGEGTRHPARALSDGTLRFLALAVLEMDPETEGVLCLEEPENGIHPARIPAILRLLRDIAVDTTESAGPDNPLRQVIVNTHSPAVFQEVPDDSVVFVKTREAMDEQKHLFRKAHSHCLSDTWRAKAGGELDVVARGDLLAYLNPVLRNKSQDATAKERRVVDRDDMFPLLPFPPPFS